MTTDEKKAKFLTYFADLPIQKLAGQFVGVHEDTVTDWKKSDSGFSDQIDNLKAQWAQRKTSQVKSQEWLLERVMNDHFGEKKKVEIEGDLKFEVVTYDDSKKDT